MLTVLSTLFAICSDAFHIERKEMDSALYSLAQLESQADAEEMSVNIVVTIGSDDDPFDPENDRNLDNDDDDDDEDEDDDFDEWPRWEFKICWHDSDCRVH